MPRPARRLLPALLASVLLLTGPVPAQEPGAFDPSVLLGGAEDVLSRAPDAQVDGLFQALHASMRESGEAEAICGLFDPGADRGIEGLQQVALALPPASRQRFADAIAGLLLAGLQGQPQPFDRETAAQALRASTARAAILHDGFTAGFAEDAPREARCRSLRQMMDVLAQRPPAERAAVTRLLLEQGLRAARAG